MALTEVPIELSSTPGIVDNSTGTAITIDVSGNVDVTGTVTADGLTVSSSAGSTSPIVNISNGVDAAPNRQLAISETGGSGFVYKIDSTGASGLFGELNLATNGTNRINIGSGGDISFYEDTGTNPKLVWKASDERLGIGTASPARILHTSGDLVRFDNSGTAGILLLDTLNNEGFRIVANKDSGAFSIEDMGTATSGAGTERLRIDFSGNLLVSNTVPVIFSSSSITGHNIAASGTAQHNASQETVMYLNRLSTDGDIVDFRKDGAPVGSIGTNSGDLTIGTGAVGIRFVDAVNSFYPWNTTTQALTDGNLDLGISGARFKDLYLSGGVFFGSDQDASNNTTTNGTDVVEGNIRVASTSYCFDANRANAVDGEVVRFRKQSVQVGSITVTGSTTAYNQSSDQRLKENIVDAPSASDDIDAIQVRSFDWKVDGSHQKYGMIAQELQTVAPEAVSAPEDPEEMMGVDFSKLVPMMLKEIQQLRARVAQLEGAN